MMIKWVINVYYKGRGSFFGHPIAGNAHFSFCRFFGLKT